MKYAAVLLFALVILPCHAEAMTPKEFDSKALPLLDKPAEASKLLKLCDQALQDATDPGFKAFVRIVKGQAYFLKNEFDQAEAEARAVIASGYQTELGYALATQALFATGRYDDGKTMCLEGAAKESNEQRKAGAVQYCEALYNEAQALTAETLWKAYKQNPGAAEKQYGGKPVTFSGTVLSVDAEGPRLVLAVDGSKNNTVVCLFAAAPEKKEPQKATSSGGSDEAAAATSDKDMSYKLDADDDAPGEAETADKQDAGEAPAAVSTSRSLPAKGATVRVTGTVRGFEGTQLVLIDCSIAD